MTEAIGEPAAGIIIKGAEEGLQRVEQSNYEHAGAKRCEVFRREINPQPLARARENKREKQQRRVVL